MRVSVGWALALTLATGIARADPPPAADSPTVVDVERGELIERGTGAHVGVTGGGYLNEVYWLQFGQELANKRAQLRYYQRDLPLYIAAILTTGISFGFALQRWAPWLISLLFPKP